VPFTLNSPNAQTFTVAQGAQIYTDNHATIDAVTPALQGLKGIRISRRRTNYGSQTVSFTLKKQARVLVGFFFSASEHHQPASPAAGGWKLQSINAVTVKGNPALAVFSRTLPVGKHTLNLGRGAYVVLGFVTPHAKLTSPIHFYPGPEDGRANLDWLFVQ
jgi:hypothetical protein